MARVTVEDCVVKVPNRFDLVMRAAQRARSISAGAELTVERDNDKNPVVALREIAEESVDVEALASSLIKDQQKHVEMDEPEEDEMDLIAMQQEMSDEIDEAAPKTEISEDVPHVEEEGAEGEANSKEGKGGDEYKDADADADADTDADTDAAQDKDGGS